MRQALYAILLILAISAFVKAQQPRALYEIFVDQLKNTTSEMDDDSRMALIEGSYGRQYYSSYFGGQRRIFIDIEYHYGFSAPQVADYIAGRPELAKVFTSLPQCISYRDCTGHGTCASQNTNAKKCQCYDDYGGSDCSLSKGEATACDSIVEDTIGDYNSLVFNEGNAKSFLEDISDVLSRCVKALTYSEIMALHEFLTEIVSFDKVGTLEDFNKFFLSASALIDGIYWDRFKIYGEAATATGGIGKETAEDLQQIYQNVLDLRNIVAKFNNISSYIVSSSNMGSYYVSHNPNFFTTSGKVAIDVTSASIDSQKTMSSINGMRVFPSFNISTSSLQNVWKAGYSFNVFTIVINPFSSNYAAAEPITSVATLITLYDNNGAATSSLDGSIVVEMNIPKLVPTKDELDGEDSQTAFTCQYWKESEGKWSSEGCSFIGADNYFYHCSCPLYNRWYTVKMNVDEIEPMEAWDGMMTISASALSVVWMSLAAVILGFLAF